MRNSRAAVIAQQVGAASLVPACSFFLRHFVHLPVQSPPGSSSCDCLFRYVPDLYKALFTKTMHSWESGTRSGLGFVAVEAGGSRSSTGSTESHVGRRRDGMLWIFLLSLLRTWNSWTASFRRDFQSRKLADLQYLADQLQDPNIQTRS